MNQKKIARRTLTAYHESGHAIAAYLLRKRFRYVTIRPDGEYEGYMRHPRSDPQGRVRSRAAIEKEIVVSLAGSASIFLLTGRRDRIGAWADHQKALDLAECVCSSRRECEAYMSWLYTRCEDMLRSQANWHALETLAEELQLQETINYRKTKEIIKAAKRQFRQRRWKDTTGKIIMFPTAGR